MIYTYTRFCVYRWFLWFCHIMKKIALSHFYIFLFVIWPFCILGISFQPIGATPRNLLFSISKGLLFIYKSKKLAKSKLWYSIVILKKIENILKKIVVKLLDFFSVWQLAIYFQRREFCGGLRHLLRDGDQQCEDVRDCNHGHGQAAGDSCNAFRFLFLEKRNTIKEYSKSR